MAYLYPRKDGRIEIREARSTRRGPRSRTLASFRGPLTEDALERAEAAATRPFDRRALRQRAAALGVPLAPASADGEARALIARLRAGARLDPVLAGLLREQLAGVAAAPVPDDLADVVEWLGASEHERGRALRDVLRLYDRIARSPDAAPPREAERFPRFTGAPRLVMGLDEKVEALARALEAAGVPHAFGGAIALAYYATPRGTRDVDVNVFLPASAFGRVLAALTPLGVEPPTAQVRRTLEREGQARLFWDRTPLDLFFSTTELHDACVERQRKVAFGSVRIAIPSPEDLAVFKVLFARDKDWRDLREMLLAQAGELDAAYALGWLERIVAPDDERLARFRALVAERAPGAGG